MKEVKKTATKKIKEVKTDGPIQEDSTDTLPTTEEVAAEEVISKPLAKKGKRSAKAVVEVDEKLAKEERKSQEAEKPKKPKAPVKPARSRLERASKKYREVAKLLEIGKEYNLKEAVELTVKTSTTKFDSTVELHINLNVDPKQADQNLRDNLVLPAGTGKLVRVAVFAEPDDVKTAKTAGADTAGGDEFLQQLDKNIVDFDLLITAPTMMPKLLNMPSY